MSMNVLIIMVAVLIPVQTQLAVTHVPVKLLVSPLTVTDTIVQVSIEAIDLLSTDV